MNPEVSDRLRGWKWAVAVVVLILLACLLGLVAFGYFNKGRPNQDLAVCGDNLRRMALVLLEYAEEHQGMFPPLSSRPGVLMFSEKAIPTERFGDPLPFTCPALRYAEKGTAGDEVAHTQTPPHDDQSYFYLGYAVLDDDDVEAFATAYRKQIAEGGSFEEDLVVADGDGTRVLHRLSKNVSEVWRATGDPNALSPHEGREAYYQVPGVVSADVPILIERDRGHRYPDWDGRPRVGHVVFLNMGLQRVEHGTWPMTEKTQRILAELAE
jgi:hypothetical protein